MMTETQAPPATRVGGAERLRRVAIRGLRQMYRADERLFVFRVRKTSGLPRQEGLSPRYTAIAALALAGEDQATVNSILGDSAPMGHLDRLLADAPGYSNLGDVALTRWAALANGHPRADATLDRLSELFSKASRFATVELAWTVSALSRGPQTQQVAALRDAAYEKLLTGFNPQSGIFSHEIGGGKWRGHIACFADFVYPIQALAFYHETTSSAEALRIANQCAARMCRLIGPAGQWWWHFDVRTGNVVEGYPVYAVHQSSMAPMTLFDLLNAGGADHRASIAQGLSWLERSPELNGGSLIDEKTGVVWRKVFRREPHKFARRVQAVASRISPNLRAPGMDGLFPPGAIDDESRPYHMGWILYAWPADRARAWDQSEAAQ